MNHPKTYPDSQVRVTDPFFLLTCKCGVKMWSLLGEKKKCPKCGAEMECKSL